MLIMAPRLWLLRFNPPAERAEAVVVILPLSKFRLSFGLFPE